MLHDFIIIWFFLEITNFIYICLLSLNLKNKTPILLYFIIQILSSFLIILSNIINRFFITNNYLWIFIYLALIIKLRIPPFHLWMPLISKYISWQILYILLTIQKIIPFYIISLIIIPIPLLYIILIFCSTIPPYIILNLNNFKIILSYSSINQTRWIILLILLKPIIWFQYFLFYCLILSCLFYFTKFIKIKKNFNTIHTFKLNLIIIIFILNLARLPPFTFFYIKWYSIFYSILNSNITLILIIIIFRSFLMLYIYANIITNLLFIFKIKSKIKYFPQSSYKLHSRFYIILQLTFSLILLII